MRNKNTLFVGKVSQRFATLPSTNDYAAKWLLSERPAEGAVVIADHQTAGRGQMGNRWDVEPGQNLTLSVIFYPQFLLADRQFQLNQAVALAVAETIAGYSDVPPKIKWPNDILVEKRKICGILIQNTLSGVNIQSSIVGAGININQTKFAPDLPNAGSLCELTGKYFKLDEVMHTLFSRLEARYLQLKQGRAGEIASDYLEHLFQKGERRQYCDPDGAVFQGVIQGVDPSGRLMMETGTGLRSFGIKEVSYIL